jgi:hypothetical protein
MSLHIPDLEFCFFFTASLIFIYSNRCMGKLASFDLSKENTAGPDRQRQAPADLAGALLGRQSRQTPLSRPRWVGPTSAESSAATG